MSGNFRLIYAAVIVVIGSEASATPFHGQVDKRIEILVKESSIMSKGQVVKLDAEKLREKFLAMFDDEELVFTRVNFSRSLTIDVIAYDSGNYLGGGKTATITVNYSLSDENHLKIREWSDSCKFRANLDFQSSEKRNIDAVNGCVKSLARNLVIDLNGSFVDDRTKPAALN